MDEYIYRSRVIELDPDQWTDEAPDDRSEVRSYAGNPSSGASSDDPFSASPWKAPSDRTHPYESSFENQGFENDFDYHHSWEYGWNIENYSEEEYLDGTYCMENPEVAHVNEPDISLDLCQRCSSKRWEAFLSTSRESRLDVGKTQLKPSSCRICRLIASVIEVHKIPNEGDYLLKSMTATAIANKAMAGLPALTGSGKLQVLHIRNLDPFIGVATKILPHLVAANFLLEENSIDKRYHQAEHVNLGQIKRWIDNCYVAHTSCSTVTKPSLRQLRVIDCDQKAVVPAPAGCQYVALSYVWGHCNGDLDNLEDPPNTIADSMLLTQRLGYKYLWIDRYVCSSRLSVLNETNKRSASTKITA